MKKSIYAKFASFLLLALGIAIPCMGFLPIFTTVGEDPTAYTAFQAFFAQQLSSSSGSLFGITGTLKTESLTSWFGIVILAAPLVGGLAAALLHKWNKIGGFIALACFAFSAVAIYFASGMAQMTSSLIVSDSVVSSSTAAFADSNYVLGLGGELIAGLSALGAGCSLGYTLSK